MDSESQHFDHEDVEFEAEDFELSASGTSATGVQWVIPADALSPDRYPELLAQARSMARSSISHFAVGVIAIGNSGQAYLGTNLEFPGQPIASSVHAEQFAVSLARHHDETGFREIIVSALPCGFCCQFLQELNQPDLPITVIPPDGETLFLTLRQLQPYPFSLASDTQSMMQPEGMLLDFHSSTPTLKHLGSAALDATSMAYVPYTQSYSGVALQLDDGTIHTGSALESAAYNPTLPAFQAALIQVVAAHHDFRDIREVLLLEPEDTKTFTATTVWNMVKAVSPTAQFEFCTVGPPKGEGTNE